eukprot:TRINITY_DN5634_c0_g2_i2.p1 TRINITY_DN5634_c0_g2~~TRINITY_DN5634_c0_g2_i2.p1  ORF type:complete len:797 (+),score=218.08 TRINITY_DN5634_c0_g2_i2:149-2539(+)
MPVNYSRWDDLAVSDSESDAERRDEQEVAKLQTALGKLRAAADLAKAPLSVPDPDPLPQEAPRAPAPRHRDPCGDGPPPSGVVGVEAMQDDPDGAFVAGDIGVGTFREGGRECAIRWRTGRTTVTAWPNEMWFIQAAAPPSVVSPAAVADQIAAVLRSKGPLSTAELVQHFRPLIGDGEGQIDRESFRAALHSAARFCKNMQLWEAQDAEEQEAPEAREAPGAGAQEECDPLPPQQSAAPAHAPAPAARAGVHRSIAARISSWCATVSPDRLNREPAKRLAQSAARAARKQLITVAALGDMFTGVSMDHPEPAAALLRRVLWALEATGYEQLAAQLHQAVLDAVQRRFDERRQLGGQVQTICSIAHLYNQELLTDAAFEAVVEELTEHGGPGIAGILRDAFCAGVVLHRCAASISSKRGSEGVLLTMHTVKRLREDVGTLGLSEIRELALRRLDEAFTRLQKELGYRFRPQDLRVFPSPQGGLSLHHYVSAVGAAGGVSILCVAAEGTRQRAMVLRALQHSALPWPQMQFLGEAALTPDQIRTIALLEMQETVGRYLSKVYTVSQRQAAGDAGITSGTPVLRIINEPNVAATPAERNVLIFGGGAFNVAVLARVGGRHELALCSAQTSIGFDSLLEGFDANTTLSRQTVRRAGVFAGGGLKASRPERLAEKEASGRETAAELETLQRRLLRAEQRAELAETRSCSNEKRWGMRIAQLEQKLESEREQRLIAEREGTRRADALSAQLQQIMSLIRAGPAQSPAAAAAAAAATVVPSGAGALYQELLRRSDPSVPTEN